jgi:hypothetical protein
VAGTWLNGTITANQCGAICTPGTPRPCSGTTPQTCNGTGDGWNNGAITMGQCGALCTPGTAGPCAGIKPQTCNSAGNGYNQGTPTVGQCGVQCWPPAYYSCTRSQGPPPYNIQSAIAHTCSPSGTLSNSECVLCFQCGEIDCGGDCDASQSTGCSVFSSPC